jgi:hypothetical protein
MVRSITGSICALAVLTLVAIGTAGAEQVITGTVKQVDPRTGVILLEDGRRVLITNGATVFSNDRPVERLAVLAPGSSVVVIAPDAPSASPRFYPDTDTPNAFGVPSPQAP